MSFPGSSRYWEQRYSAGGDSGPGSTGGLAPVKASIINRLIASERIESVIEFGCGDGSQLDLATYPSYVGLDVSVSAIERCKERFASDTSKSFFLYEPHAFVDRHRLFHAELALSLEVIFHLVEDELFELHMRHLFSAGDRYVVVCSSNVDIDVGTPQRRHRAFTPWAEREEPAWRLVETIENPLGDWGDAHLGARQDFFVYAKRS